MPIYRSKRPPFTIIPNATLTDDRLSLKARGLLAYMLSMSDGWAFYTSEMVKHFPDGIKAVRAGLSELERTGYLVRNQSRSSTGQMSELNWYVRDTPEAQNGSPATSPETQNGSSVMRAAKTMPHRSLDHASPEVPKRHAANGALTSNNINKEQVTSNNVADYDDDIRNTSSVVNKDKTDTPKQTSSFHSVTEFWQKQGFGALAPLTSDKLREWWKDFQAIGSSPDDAAAVLIKGMEIAIDAGKTNYGYLNGILHNWEAKHLTTVQAVEANEAEHAASPTKSQQSSKGNAWRPYLDSDYWDD
ncbi:MAG: DnaD domain protein [Lacticaseibacillus songhuajiangensis]|jgi:DnaD/phage-associated family protein|nr:DnaD domain protein [Lacticaseibacillus songhuajiangensis]